MRSVIDEKLLVSSGTSGYRIPYTTLIFQRQAQWYRCQKCQRLHAHGNHLPCPHKSCGERLDVINVQTVQAQNFFYQSLNQPIVPIRVEEHTAQLSPEQATAVSG